MILVDLMRVVLEVAAKRRRAVASVWEERGVRPFMSDSDLYVSFVTRKKSVADRGSNAWWRNEHLHIIKQAIERGRAARR